LLALELPRALLGRIEEEARSGYPEEVCGFLFSPPPGPRAACRRVTRVEPALNEADGGRGNRFVISAERLRAVEREATVRGEVVGGFYHSHPDHAPLPSAADTEGAWPWYAYLIVAVHRGGTCSHGAFELVRPSGRLATRRLQVTVDGSAIGSRSDRTRRN